jgi:RNA polymerase sigma-70 factor (ECF subfamily)
MPGALPDDPASGTFHTTRWSVVRSAGGASPEARAALEALCSTYWYPLYAYLRRSGRRAEDARDLVQGLFAKLLARRSFADLTPEGGRFRSWLLAALKNHAADERDREIAAKRGGGRAQLSIDLDGAEERYRRDPADLETPETLFERRWALVVLERALARLRAEEHAAGRSERFAHLEPALAGGAPSGGWAALARELGTSENALTVAAHRLRRRYRDLVALEVAPTVDRPQEVEDEIASLFRALRGPERAGS